MITVQTPNGLPVQVPETQDEDRSPKFDLSMLAEATAYYQDHGYVIFKRLLSTEVCDRARDLWEQEVKPSKGFMYRQATAKAEKHVFNENGWVMNPILNLQSLHPQKYGQLRSFTIENILAAEATREAFSALLGETPKIVQSMYFEGNSATWEHQDSYYLDSENMGTMTAAWIALEDITATAGRFFVCPKTHLLALEKQNKETNIADHHDVYIQKIVELIRSERMEIKAPCLEKGDVLFWNARTIHGSLKSEDKDHSRSSITIHAIPASDRFLQLQTRLLDVPTEEVNGSKVWRPKDQAHLKYKSIMFLESNFPKAFYGLKRLALRLLIK